jgi:hypothetical protein
MTCVTYDLMMWIHSDELIIYVSSIKLQKWITYEIEIEIFNEFSYDFPTFDTLISLDCILYYLKFIISQFLSIKI